MSKKKQWNCKMLVLIFYGLVLLCMADLSVFAGAVTVVNGISKTPKNTSNTNSQYSPYWQYWSQGASQYSGMRSGGCRVTAFAKLIKEAGYDNFANPDDFLIWGINRGYFKSTSNVYEITSFGEAIKRYISDQGGTCTLIATNTLSNTSTDKANIMSYINQGYYVVLSSTEHTAYIGRAASIQQGTPVILDSWASWSTNPATSHTYTGSYDSMSECSFTKYRVYAVSEKNVDTTPPVISNIQVTNVDNTGYTITCTVTDNSGSISRVQFPTWTEANGQDDLVADWGSNISVRGTMNGNQATFRVNVSEHNYEEGRYWTHIYAYDNSGNYVSVEAGAIIDRTGPTISKVWVTDISSNSYTVWCEVSDASGINRVQFPTWTDKNLQDDLQIDWWTNSNCSGGWTSGNTYSFKVNGAKHNYEVMGYTTEIFAFDTYGNFARKSVYVSSLLGEKIDFGNEFVATIENIHSKTVITNDGTNVSGSAYKANLNQQWLFKKDSDGNYKIYSMSEPNKCLEVYGGSDSDGSNVQVGTADGANSQSWGIYGTIGNGYFLMPGCSDMRVLDLDKALSQDGTNVQIYRSYTDTPQKFSIHYLCTSLNLSATKLNLQKGETKTITAQVTPTVATNQNVVWSSTNEEVATVVNGKITAKAPGTAIVKAITQDSVGGNNQIMKMCEIIVQGDSNSSSTENDKKEHDNSNKEGTKDDVDGMKEETDTEINNEIDDVDNDIDDKPDDDNNISKPKSENTVITFEKERYIVTSSKESNPTVEYDCHDNHVVKAVVPDKITHNGVTYKVTSIRKNAFKNNKKLKRVTIGQNVKFIGDNAFEGCVKLEKVTIQSTVLKKIGKNAFKNDKKLKTIIIKSNKLSRSSIGKNALKGTNKNLKIKVPAKKVKTYRKYFKKKGNSRVKVTK